MNIVRLLNLNSSKNLKLIRRISLVLLLVLAFTLRIWNIDWDEGTHQHPDERYWSMVTEDIGWSGTSNYFDSKSSDLNPYNHRDTWVYGTFPLFLTKAVSHYLEKDSSIPNLIVDSAQNLGIDLKDQITSDTGQIEQSKAFDSGYKANLIGRLLSAAVDTGTILLVYLLGRELFNRRSGFLSAILQTFTVLHIQYSHFYGAEPWVAFFATLTVLLSVKLFKRLRLLDTSAVVLSPKTVSLLVFTGLVFGLAAASKLIGLAVGIVPVLVLFLCFSSRFKSKDQNEKVRELSAFFGSAALLLFIAFWVFRIFQPYAFDGLISFDPRFLSDIDYISSINAGADVPWVLQWVGITPLWYPIKSVFWHGMGPALATTVLFGTCLTIYEATKKRKQLLLVPLSFVFIMIGLVSQQFNPLIRYLLPAYPVAITFGGYGIYFLWEWGKTQKKLPEKKKAIGRASQTCAAVLVGGTLIWGAAFVNGIYNNTHPRLEASEWINENIDSGSTITRQIWDDSLPLAIPSASKPELNYVELDLFRSDSLEDPRSGKPKLETLLDSLDETDYIIEASNRLYGSIPRAPAEYPGTSAYYKSLFSGDLGFELVARFENSPSLFGIHFSDNNGEETFTVYDHPQVLIWSKTDQWSRDNALRILNPFRATHAPNLIPKDAGSNALQLRPAEISALENDLTFDQTFTEKSYFGIPDWLWWLLWLQIAAFAVLPWSTLLFRQLADSGYALTKAIGFLSTGLLVWICVAWDFCQFNQRLTVLCMLALACIGISLWWKHRVRLRDLISQHRFVWLASEIIFLATFFFFLLIRYRNPDLWESYLGGEKPMELGYLTAVGRSPELPPYDPWFAGGSMNYYYFGWFLLAVPMRALKLLPEITFQLGVATFAALAGVIVFSLVYNLSKINRPLRVRKITPIATATMSGVLGVFFLLGSGTFDAVRVHFARLRSVNTWTLVEDWPVLGAFSELIGGTWLWISGASLPSFDWWASSRVNSGNFDITEFPYFTFLFGDLHPHMMGIPVTLLSLSLGLTYLLSCRQEIPKNRTYLAICIGLASGVARMTNTWDYPTSILTLAIIFLLGACLATNKSLETSTDNKASLFGVAGLAICLSALGSGGNILLIIFGLTGILGALSVFCTPINRGRVLQFICHFFIAIVSHIGLTWPYLRNSKNFNVGIHRSEWTSPLSDFLSHWGIFLSIAIIFFAVILIEGRKEDGKHNITIHFLPAVLRKNIWTRTFLAGLLIGLLGLCVWWVSAAFAITILGGLSTLLLSEYEFRKPHPKIGNLFALIMFMLGFAVVGGPEIITVNNDVARMNTVFKFWLQGWIFFAVGSAFAVYQIGAYVRSLTAENTVRPPISWVTAKRVWGLLTVVIILIGITYPLLATKPRLSTRFNPQYKGLNGIAYLNYEPSITRRDSGSGGQISEVVISDDLPLIQWLRSNVPGSPTIVEWSGESYDWNGRIANHTGLPTVLGWSSHQYQQRQEYIGLINKRRSDVQLFFTESTLESISDFLLTYEAKYVILGTQEHRFGNPDILKSIENHPGLRTVFKSGRNIILAVETEALWAYSSYVN